MCIRDRHWVEWDRAILYHRGFAAGGLQREIESLGPVGPIYLELCYLCLLYTSMISSTSTTSTRGTMLISASEGVPRERPRRSPLELLSEKAILVKPHRSKVRSVRFRNSS